MSARHLLHAAVETLRISLPTVVESAFGKLDADVCNTRLDSWSRSILERARVQLLIEGVENFPPGEAMVVMSNHQSLYDVPAIYQALKRPLRMVTKTELFRIPIWSRAMRCAGFIEVDRSDPEKARRSLQSAESLLAKGTSIWIAPEGTRSRSGALGPFKKGGFHLALAARARILPVSITGTEQVLTATGRRVREGVSVRVVVSPPVDATAFGEDALEPLMAEVRSAIEQHLPNRSASVEAPAGS